MLFNKLALTLLSIVALAAALPTPSTNVAPNTNDVKRGSDSLVKVITEPDTIVDPSEPEPRGCSFYSE